MKRLMKVIGWGFLALLAIPLAAAASLGIQRVRTVELPRPRGAYAVGRLITEWTDSARAETLGGSGGPRRLSVWIWYPARAGGKPAPYLTPAWARALEAQRPWPVALLFQATWSIHPHALAGAPPVRSAAPFPVLVFQPGLHAQVTDCTTLAEDLASRGYLVVGLNPTYNAPVTVLGREVLPQSRLTSSSGDGTPGSARRQGARMLEVWAGDQRFAMDRLTRLAAEAGPWSGLLDVRRFGLWGWSFGGAAAWKACRADDRCAGAANLDGDLWGAVASSGSDQPVLFVGNEQRPAHPNPEIDSVLGRSPQGVRRGLAGMAHGNFADIAVTHLSPLYRILGGVGSIDGAKGLAWTADELDAFFRPLLVGAAGKSNAR